MRSSGIKIFILSILGLLSSCSTEVIKQTDTGDVIEFASTVSKAAVDNNFSEGSSFSVWGWRTNSENQQNAVFDNTEVKNYAGYWGYEGVQYWYLDNTYDFYAVYPFGNGNVFHDGTILISDFDSSKTGTDVVDLMTAEKTVFYDGSNSGRVDLKFRHLLAKVSILGHSEGSDAHIESISLTGVGTKGSYTKNISEEKWTVDSASGLFEKSDFNLTSTPSDIFGTLLLIPQSVDKIKLNIEYSYPEIIDSSTGKPLVKNLIYNLPASYSWEAGKSYRYTFALNGDYIIFDTPQINQWNDASGGIIIVD